MKQSESSSSKKGRSVWRTIEERDLPVEAQQRELAASDVRRHEDALALKQAMEGELISPKSLLGRRSFMATTGVAAAGVTLAGCGEIRRPKENIMPYVEAPEHVVPGVPLTYATVFPRREDAVGLVVTTYEGRPTKIEGNPHHPASQGSTDAILQASIMDLYDPDRSRSPAKRSGEGFENQTSEQFLEFMQGLASRLAEQQGRGLRVLAEPSTSPLFVALRNELQTRLPQAKFHVYSSVHDSNVVRGSYAATGQMARPVYRLNRARIVLSVASDFLDTESSSIRHTREHTSLRDVPRVGTRLYVVEPGFTVTGGAADHRLPLPMHDCERYLVALVRALISRGVSELEALTATTNAVDTAGIPARWLEEVARELVTYRGRSAVLVGSGLSPRAHALGLAINQALGNLSAQGAVGFSAVTDARNPETDELDPVADLRALVEAVNQGEVETLVMLGGNPVYDAPADIDVAAALRRDGLTSIHLAAHRNETSLASTWHVPECHPLETWDVRRSIDGTTAIQQPMIRSLWEGARSDIEILALLNGHSGWRAYRRVTEFVDIGDETRRREILQRGYVEVGSLVSHPVDVDVVAQSYRELPAPAGLTQAALEVVFVADPKLYDGRHANNPWLLELADPMTKIVWDNAAQISPATAAALNLSQGDIVKLGVQGAEIEIPIWPQPGLALNTLVLPLGWGRDPEAAGRYANPQAWAESTIGGWNGLPVGFSHGTHTATGFDVRNLRTSGAFFYAKGVSLSSTGRVHRLVQTQTWDSMIPSWTDETGRDQARPLAIDGSLLDVGEVPPDSPYHQIPSYQEEPRFPSFRAVQMPALPISEWPDYSEGHKWGMTIDLSKCTGCNACVVACQAENNIPTVGKAQVWRGREMAWIRLDRYFVTGAEYDETSEEAESPLVQMQPIPCQQCERATCEVVCPVNATTHTPEGLNDMTYNRCVGTRYCANNCPYKVRRFNYLDWHDWGDPHEATPPVKEMQFNPNVTVRMRGVMEKCTYCVQRIQAAKIDATVDGRRVRDGEIQTACQQACPAQAIVFGDLNDESSRVTQTAGRSHNYSLLAEVGNRPRTTYLARIRNPNPRMLGGPAVHLEAEVEG